jgi:soluble lytic murein transglycosylase-like protein
MRLRHCIFPTSSLLILITIPMAAANAVANDMQPQITEIPLYYSSGESRLRIPPSSVELHDATSSGYRSQSTIALFAHAKARRSDHQSNTNFVTYTAGKSVDRLSVGNDGPSVEALGTDQPKGSLGENKQDVAPALCGPSGLSKSAIQDLVIRAARDYQIDEKLALAIAFVESGFDRWRNSPKGARGVMQLMPSTAARFGVSDVCDPRANIAAGTRYLRLLHEQFRNPLLVAAAYNAGESRIYEYGGIPPFAETVSYVAKVVNYQLGVDLSSGRKAKLPPRSPSPQLTTDDPQAGIIPILKRGTFSGGVMHF